jgi:DoxX-like family
MKKLLFLCQLIPAVILLQTLYFKFTAAPESVWIFTTLGAEPFGRIGSGIIELIAAVLILLPTTKVWGAVLVMGTLAGAILSHVFILGIEVQGDGGTLFALACVAFVCAAIVGHSDRERLLKLF